MLLSGDNHQKPPPGETPWHQLLVKVDAEELDDPLMHGSSYYAKQRGLNLLRAARRVDFKRLMRARHDPEFLDQIQMRRADVVHPIPDRFLQQLRTVTKEDLEDDAAWRFAPIGVLSYVERDAINTGQIKAFASAFNLPIFVCVMSLSRAPLLKHKACGISSSTANQTCGRILWRVQHCYLWKRLSRFESWSMDHQGFWTLFNVVNNADLTRMKDAYNTGFDSSMVTLESTPLAVNVVIGGTDDMPFLWHEVPLPDLTRLIPKLSVPPGTKKSSEQSISLLLSPHKEKVDCYSVYAAQQTK